jgi:hypothetical protein
MTRDAYYRHIKAKPLKPKTRAAMYGRRGTARHRDDPPPDLRHAILEPTISRITPDVGGDVRIHLAAGISVAMPPRIATDITRFAVRLYRAHQAFVTPQIACDWSDYVKSKIPP